MGSFLADLRRGMKEHDRIESVIVRNDRIESRIVRNRHDIDLEIINRKDFMAQNVIVH